MHTHLLGQLPEGERSKRSAAQQVIRLTADHTLRNIQQGIAAFFNAGEHKARPRQPLDIIRLHRGAFVRAQYAVIHGRNTDRAHPAVVDLHAPLSIHIVAHQVGYDIRHGIVAKRRSRMRVERADGLQTGLLHQTRDAGLLGDLLEPACRQIFQIVMQQRFKRRVALPGMPQLQRQAVAQIARAHAGRVKRAKPFHAARRHIHRNAQQTGNLLRTGIQKALPVERIDQEAQAAHLIRIHGARIQLAAQMVAQAGPLGRGDIAVGRLILARGTGQRNPAATRLRHGRCRQVGLLEQRIILDLALDKLLQLVARHCQDSKGLHLCLRQSLLLCKLLFRVQLQCPSPLFCQIVLFPCNRPARRLTKGVHAKTIFFNQLFRLAGFTKAIPHTDAFNRYAHALGERFAYRTA